MKKKAQSNKISPENIAFLEFADRPCQSVNLLDTNEIK